MNYPTRFDSSDTQKILDKAKIRVPVLEDYAWRLWDYWERQLDPDLSIDRSLRGAVKGKVVVITGGSSGIGEAAAIRIAEAGGKVVIVARDEEKLAEVRKKIADSRRHREDLFVRHHRLRGQRPAGEGHPQGIRPRRRAGEQRRPLDPPLARAVLRPLPRLRAHDAAELLRLRAPHHEPAAVDDGAPGRPRHQRVVDRRADQRAAVLGLRGLEGRARVVRALRRLRVPRRERALHDHQHAAGAHADDRAHQDLRGDADHHLARRKRPT